MIDHLVLATPGLAVTVDDLWQRGLATSPGGAHVGLGTRNHLAGLGGGTYLEVVGPDPDQPEPAGMRPFGVDLLREPALVAWCARPARSLEDVVGAAQSAGYDPGPIGSMSRRRPDGVLLSWRLTAPPSPLPSTLPFLIDWLDSPHPTASLGDGARLTELVLTDPDPDRLRGVLVAMGELDDRMVLREGPPALAARITSGSSVIEL